MNQFCLLKPIDAGKVPSAADLKFPSTLQYRKVKTITLENCLAVSKSIKSADKWMEIIESIDEHRICTRNPIGYGACAGKSTDHDSRKMELKTLLMDSNRFIFIHSIQILTHR